MLNEAYTLGFLPQPPQTDEIEGLSRDIAILRTQPEDFRRKFARVLSTVLSTRARDEAIQAHLVEQLETAVLHSLGIDTPTPFPTE